MVKRVFLVTLIRLPSSRTVTLRTLSLIRNRIRSLRLAVHARGTPAIPTRGFVRSRSAAGVEVAGGGSTVKVTGANAVLTASAYYDGDPSSSAGWNTRIDEECVYSPEVQAHCGAWNTW